MAHLITFTSSRFDIAREPVNPINPIAGFGPLAWLRERLLALGYRCSEVDAEDWGWYLTVTTSAGPYLVGCSADADDDDDDDADIDEDDGEDGDGGPTARAEARGGDAQASEFRLQIDTVRSLKDRLTGAHVLDADDPLSGRIEQLLREDPATTHLNVDRSR